MLCLKSPDCLQTHMLEFLRQATGCSGSRLREAGEQQVQRWREVKRKQGRETEAAENDPADCMTRLGASAVGALEQATFQGSTQPHC